MKVIDCEQGSPEWRAARCARVTASRISDMLAKTKSGAEGAGRRNYRAELVTEIMTGEPYPEGFVSQEMKWGTEHEPYALMAYEVAKGFSVTRAGFVVHPLEDRSGCSPDGLVMEEWRAGIIPAEKLGCLQIKCPSTATHIGYLLRGDVPWEHEPQMQWEMACTGRAWCDFASYDPRMPKHLRLFVVRLLANAARQNEILAETRLFLREVDDVVRQLKALQ